jgi:Demerecviridae HNH endonuclease
MNTQIEPTTAAVPVELARADEPKAIKKPRSPRKITAARVRQLLDCDPAVGILTWKFRPDGPRQWNTRYAGKRAGHLRKNDGYESVRIDGKEYLSHRVIFFHQKGYWPPVTLDHVNGKRAGSGNALGNLRPATVEQNHQNQTRRSKLGYPRGCWQDPKNGRWKVHIQANGKRIWVGSFSERGMAERAYLDAAFLLHGKFSLAERPK